MIEEVFESMEDSVSKALVALKSALSRIRTGRANAALLDSVRVDYYGTLTPLNQLATLHVPEPSLITCQPWDVSQIGAIEKSIRASDLGLNPSNDGKIIRIPIPPLTEERRKQLVKHLHTVTEDHRVAVRNIRRDANDALKRLLKDKAISEDEDRRAHDEIQKLTDEFVKLVDEASKSKEKEILEL